MASLRATAKELLEQTRRLVGNLEPPRLARCAILSFVSHLKQQRGLDVSADRIGSLTPRQSEAPPRMYSRRSKESRAALRFAPACDVDGPLIDPSAFIAADETLQQLAQLPDGIGRLWQAINEPALQSAFAAAGKGTRKFSAAEISAVTQLFTPPFVVDFLLQTTLGRAWLDRHPDTRLPIAYRRGRESVPATFDRIKDLRLIDPACGTMNFGVAAIDLFRQMYREELTRAGEPGWPAESSVRDEANIDDAILRHNLFGAELDPFVLDLARFTIELKLGRQLDPAQLNFFCGDSLLGAQLDRRWPERFDVVVTNPPYLSARNISPAMATQWKRNYPLAARDAYACFIDRSLRLLRSGGRAGLLTMHSFMFTGSYEPLRQSIADRAAIEEIVHFGPGLFDTGNPGTLQTVAFVVREETDERVRTRQKIYAVRMVEESCKETAMSALAKPQAVGEARENEFLLTQESLTRSPRGSWIYWLSDRQREVIATFPKLQDIAPPRQGLATTDNLRFVRGWWEVEPFSRDASCHATDSRWVQYVKAGQNRRWYESPRHRVNWQEDGAEIKATIVEKYPYLRGKWEWVAKNAAYYGRGGVTYSYLTSGRFSARQLEPGCIFDVAGSSLFPADPLLTLAVLNSSAGRGLLAAINPTVNFQVGDLAELPMPTDGPASLRENVSELIELQRQLDSFDETAPDFLAPHVWTGAEEIWHATTARIDRFEHEIDECVAGLYGLPIAAVDKQPVSIDLKDLAARWMSFALPDAMAGAEWSMIDAGLAARVSQSLEKLAGPAASNEIDRTLGGIEPFLRGQFVAWHGRLMKSRPRWWVFGDRERQVLIAHDRAERATLVSAMRACRLAPPAQWERVMDDGIAVNLAPLRGGLVDRVLQKALNKIAKAASRGGLAWSRTYHPRKVQSRIELRMRSSSDVVVACAVRLASSEQVNSAPIR